MKYCETCQHPRAIMMYGNRTQARQAAKATDPLKADDLVLCTNSDGSVHIAGSLAVIEDE